MAEGGEPRLEGAGGGEVESHTWMSPSEEPSLSHSVSVPAPASPAVTPRGVTFSGTVGSPRREAGRLDNSSPGAVPADQRGGGDRASERLAKPYDYLLKFLLVGDSDVGKEEILQSDCLKRPAGAGWEPAGQSQPLAQSPVAPLPSSSSAATASGGPAPQQGPPVATGTAPAGGQPQQQFGSLQRGAHYASTTLVLDGKRVHLQLWSASGQGRFSTILRSFARGAHGILLVYDITNKWSFLGLDRWLQEVESHAPGLPRVLIGNRLHMAFNRRVGEAAAEAYARKRSMRHYEVSSLCDYNVVESFARLARDVMARNGMGRAWGEQDVLTLSELCCRTIVERTTLYGLEHLLLPTRVKAHLKYYSMTHKTHARCGAEDRSAHAAKEGGGAGCGMGRRQKGRSKSMKNLRPAPMELGSAGRPEGDNSKKKACTIS